MSAFNHIANKKLRVPRSTTVHIRRFTFHKYCREEGLIYHRLRILYGSHCQTVLLLGKCWRCTRNQPARWTNSRPARYVSQPMASRLVAMTGKLVRNTLLPGSHLGYPANLREKIQLCQIRKQVFSVRPNSLTKFLLSDWTAPWRKLKNRTKESYLLNFRPRGNMGSGNRQKQKTTFSHVITTFKHVKIICKC